MNVDPSTGSFSAVMTGLEPGMSYQIRAYGANESGLSYSGMVTVTVPQGSL